MSVCHLLIGTKSKEMAIITKQDHVKVQPNPENTCIQNDLEIYNRISLCTTHKIVAVMHI
uniref:Uncharacterized protein n=1 Tax=Arundo donax TaxID=35708 RepID=A0A0A9G3Y8_ARUDO